MLISTIIEVELNSNNIKYYEDKGYLIPRIKDNHYRLTVPKGTKIKVNINDLPKGSSVIVKVKCDYCGKEINKTYDKYNKQLKNSIIKKDCCKDCSHLKAEEVFELKYGVKQNSQIEEVRQNISNKNKINESIIDKDFQELGYIKLSKYEDCKTPIKFICKKHKELGIQQTTYSVVKQYQSGCKGCRYDKISGKNQWQWKGGITNLSIYLRGKIYFWQKDTKNNIENKCFITGTIEDLEIHHIHPFKYIVIETMEKLKLPIYEQINKYTTDELKQIENKCLELHYKYGFGIFLNNKIHNLFHVKFGEEISNEELLKFKYNYKRGLYDNELEEKLKSYNFVKEVS